MTNSEFPGQYPLGFLQYASGLNITTGGLVVIDADRRRPLCLEVFDSQTGRQLTFDLNWFKAFREGVGDNNSCPYVSVAAVGNLVVFVEDTAPPRAVTPVDGENPQSLEVFAVDPRSGREVWRNSSALAGASATPWSRATAGALMFSWTDPQGVAVAQRIRLNPENGEVINGVGPTPTYEVSVTSGKSAGWAIDVSESLETGYFDLRTGETVGTGDLFVPPGANTALIRCSYTSTDGSRFALFSDASGNGEIRTFPGLELVQTIEVQGRTRNSTENASRCNAVNDDYVLFSWGYFDRASAQLFQLDRGGDVPLSIADGFFVIKAEPPTDSQEVLESLDPTTGTLSSRNLYPFEPFEGFSQDSIWFRNVVLRVVDLEDGNGGKEYFVVVVAP